MYIVMSYILSHFFEGLDSTLNEIQVHCTCNPFHIKRDCVHCTCKSHMIGI